MTRELLIKALEQAKKAILAASHAINCGFSACTCGRVENFKIESGEFWRIVYGLSLVSKICPWCQADISDYTEDSLAYTKHIVGECCIGLTD